MTAAACLPKPADADRAECSPALAADDVAYPPIADYAAVGDCRTVALVSRQGSVDWLCLPGIAGSAVFAAMLDRRRGGRFALRPCAPFRTERRYLEGTNVLETTFTTASGRARVTDLMVLNGADGGGLEPERELLRVADGAEGEVELEALYEPRPDYARPPLPRLVRRGALGWSFQHRGEAFLLGAEMEMRPTAGGTGLRGSAVLRAGERRRFSLSHATRDMLVVPPLGAAADKRLAATVRWWRDWSARCRFDHRHGPVVLRSALALKLLTYGLSGAVVAAATTSLPEAVGGGRNWDYRFCWLRDAATTLRAFADLGFEAEGRAYLGWLLHSTRLTRPRLMVLYDVHGRPQVKRERLGLSRLSLPFLFGTFVTADRGRAVLAGVVMYLAGGWAFAVLYFFVFSSLGLATWWLGAALEALHGLFLLVALPAMAQLHPRVASEYDAPTGEPKLEPPGFMGLNYGHRTPLMTLLGQVAYGAVLGAFLPMR